MHFFTYVKICNLAVQSCTAMHFTPLEIRVEQDFLASLKPTVKKVQFLRENSNRGKEFFLRNETKIDFFQTVCATVIFG